MRNIKRIFIFIYINMPALDISLLDKLQEDYTKYNCFVETGTLYGKTIFAVEPYFNKLYTIEISNKHYTNAKNKYTGNKINFLLGDSGIVFKSLLPTINEKSIFFLDGHWSSGDTESGEKHVPLQEEITHINDLFQNEAIIIIDDFRLFGKRDGGIVDWTNINKDVLLKILASRLNKCYNLESNLDKDDRLVIHINAKQ